MWNQQFCSTQPHALNITAALGHTSWWRFRRYGELEAHHLKAQMGSVPLPDATAEELELVVSGLASSVALATAHVQSAAERCGRLTGAPNHPEDHSSTRQFMECLVR